MPTAARGSWSRALGGRDWARAGSPTATRQLSNGLNTELAPGADRLATELRAGQGRLGQLRLAARATENRVLAAWQTLNSMTVGKTDPRFAQALAEVGAAVGAATGRNPLTGAVVFQPYQGLDAALGQAVAETGQAADGATRLSAGAREAAGGAQRLATGADELEGGLVRLENGNLRLQRGLADLAAGSEELRDGLGRLGVGHEQLAGGLESGNQRSAPLESGLADGALEVGMTRDQLVSRTGPFRPLRSLAQLQRQSPGFFRSGYVTVAALDGARALDRDASSFMLDPDRAGGRVARISILPDVPANDPRTEEMVGDVTTRRGTSRAARGWTPRLAARRPSRWSTTGS